MFLNSFFQDNGLLKDRANDLFTAIETSIVNNEPPKEYRHLKKIVKDDDLNANFEKLY